MSWGLVSPLCLHTGCRGLGHLKDVTFSLGMPHEAAV